MIGTGDEYRESIRGSGERCPVGDETVAVSGLLDLVRRSAGLSEDSAPLPSNRWTSVS